MIAADGFDFSKPYESSSPSEISSDSSTPSNPTMRKPGRMVAALLGGIKKPQP